MFNRFNGLVVCVCLMVCYAVNGYALNRVYLGPEYFPKSDIGRPVAGGEIYVGKPDTDPTIVANQKQVTIQEEDGDLIEISQPVDISAGGVPEYNGSPVTIFVDGDYSLRVNNSAGSQVYYIPNTGSALGFNPGNYYYPSSDASDHGITGSSNTVKYYVDQIGSDDATLYFKHDSGGVTTAYTFLTAETIPDNITLESENGAMLVPVSGVTVKPYSPAHMISATNQQIYDLSGGGVIRYQSNQGAIYPEQFGIDGTADQVEINYSLASVTAPVVKLTGQYTLTDEILLKGNSGSITADSWGVSVSFANSLTSGKYAITNFDPDTGNDNWLIAGFLIDCNRSGSPASNVGIYLFNSDNNRIEDMDISSPSNHCIALEGSDRNWVTLNRLVDFEGFGVVAIRGSNYNHIVTNYLNSSESGSNAIAVDDWSTSGDSYDSAYNQIRGNTIVGANDAIVIEGCTRNLIVDNIIYSPIRYGIITSVGSAGDNVRTSLDAQYNLIDTNYIYSSGSHSIRILGDYNTTKGNEIYDAGGHGIYAASSPILLRLIDNSIYGYASNGIRAEGGQQYQIDGNYLLGIDPYGNEGIYITSSDGTMQTSSISSNQFHNIGKEGIKIIKGGSDLRNMVLDSNKFTDVSLASADTYYCIDIEGAVSEISTKDNWWRGAGSAAGLINYTGSDALTTNAIGNNAGSQSWDFGPFADVVADEKSGTLTGATDKIEVDIPSGSIILGISLNNESAVTDSAGDDTYTAAFSGGLSVAINGGAAIAAAQNTKVKQMFDQNAASMLTAGETDITLTPNGGDFTAGNVRAIVKYIPPPNDLPDSL